MSTVEGFNRVANCCQDSDVASAVVDDAVVAAAVVAGADVVVAAALVAWVELATAVGVAGAALDVAPVKVVGARLDVAALLALPAEAELADDVAAAGPGKAAQALMNKDEMIASEESHALVRCRYRILAYPSQATKETRQQEEKVRTRTIPRRGQVCQLTPASASHRFR